VVDNFDMRETSVDGSQAVPLGKHQDQLDDLDRRIVVALQVNVRASWNQIARALGSSESTIARRANRLLDEGLLKFLVAPEASRANVSESVLLEINCEPGSIRSVAQAFAERAGVRFTAMVTGPFDVLVEHEIESRQQLNRLLIDELAPMPGVQQITTLSVTKNFKKANEWARHLLGAAADELTIATPDRAALPAMDQIDRALIDLLREDARRSSADLATALSISDSMVRRRLEALIASKSVSFSTYIEPHLMGFGLEAFIWLDVDFASMAAVAEQLRALPQVRYLAATAGSSSLVCEVILPDGNALYDFQSTVLGSCEGLRQASISLELQTIKRSFVQIAQL
jgi:DNA-binding Lrp family transcriptional regulator